MEGFIFLTIAVICIYFLVKGAGENTIENFEVKSQMESNMICPYCQTKGSVTTKKIKRKAGISGGKATAGILTCGISLLGTGLSRKELITEACCSNCGALYSF